MLETLAHIGREVASILDLDELLTAIAQHVRRVINYRTFGILLLDAQTNRLEMKLAVKYGEQAVPPPVKLGEGLCGYAALHKEAVLVPDVSKDRRYVKFVEDARSELVVPLLVKDRCIGVFDLESPELDAFSKAHQEILTLLASQAAVAIENARLYEAVRANEVRIESELHFAQRVQMALLPAGLPKRMKGVEVVARLAPARELIRSRTFRRRYAPEPASPSGVLASINTILHERELFEYYCTLCYAQFDLKRRTVALANSGLPYPIRCAGDRCEAIELAGVPLGSFAGSSYDDLQLDLHGGDLFVFYTDGVPEALDAQGREFGTARLIETVHAARGGKAQAVVDAIFDTVHAFRGNAPPGDDMTAVVVRLMI
jgi:sigma-B regulation protein RsbU (phosphoserine phosphatase)